MKILHIDDHILIVDKPAGISVLPDGWDPDSPYVLKMLEAEHGRLWVIHRLDKLTSGVLLFARSAEAHRHLSIQFERREVEKIYHAILAGSPPWARNMSYCSRGVFTSAPLVAITNGTASMRKPDTPS